MSSVSKPVQAGTGLAARLRALLRARPRSAALLCGVGTALALPPLHLLPLLFGFAGLAFLVSGETRPRAAFTLGWWFGFGHFGIGLHWLAAAFLVEPERYGLLALPAVLLLAAGLALFPATALALVALRRWQSPLAHALAIALAWFAAEAVRGIVGKFPWNLIGYALAVTPAFMQPAAWIGAWGLSLIVIVLAVLPAVALAPGVRRGWPFVLSPLLAVAVIAGLGTARLADAPQDDVADLRLRIVQANVAQFHKWDPDLIDRWFRRHLELSRADADGITHVVWPESATPYQLERDPVARRMIAEATPPGGLLITGGERFDLGGDDHEARNSLFVLDETGDIAARYDKVDLVPFGEYLPFRMLLGRLGLGNLTRGTIDFVPGPGRRSLAFDGLPAFSPLICYEAIFPGRAIDRDARPAWILNVTNDGWFGRSAGPHQHLAMARLRAVEEGLPLVRAANTGISAVIDAHGRMRAQLGLTRSGVIDSALPVALASPPPFVRHGGWLIASLVVGLFLAIVLVEARQKSARSGPQDVNKT